MHSLNTTIYSRDVLITRVLPLIYKKEMKKVVKRKNFIFKPVICLIIYIDDFLRLNEILQN